MTATVTYEMDVVSRTMRFVVDFRETFVARVDMQTLEAQTRTSGSNRDALLRQVDEALQEEAARTLREFEDRVSRLLGTVTERRTPNGVINGDMVLDQRRGTLPDPRYGRSRREDAMDALRLAVQTQALTIPTANAEDIMRNLGIIPPADTQPVATTFTPTTPAPTKKPAPAPKPKPAHRGRQLLIED